jgi:hypothetical protein
MPLSAKADGVRKLPAAFRPRSPPNRVPKWLVSADHHRETLSVQEGPWTKIGVIVGIFALLVAVVALFPKPSGDPATAGRPASSPFNLGDAPTAPNESRGASHAVDVTGGNEIHSSPSPRATRTERPVLPAGSVIFAEPFDDWFFTGSFAASGQDLYISTEASEVVIAPVTLAVDDYVVTVDIQIPSACGNIGIFGQDCESAGIVVRGEEPSANGSIETQAYYVGFQMNTDGLTLFAGDYYFVQSGAVGSRELQPDTDWHTLRVSVIRNHITVWWDGREALSADDNEHVTGRHVGVFGAGLQLTLRNFTVTVP